MTSDATSIDPSEVNLATRLGPLALHGPVMTASGCAAAGAELSQFFDLRMLGAVVTKSIMMQPRSGRPTPRMAETPSGMLNSIGLQGPGVEAFIAKDLAWLAERGVRTIVSIAGTNTADYARLARRLSQEPAVAALEVNISCPNVESRGEVFACDPRGAASVVAAVRAEAARDLPVIVKLSPDVTDIVDIAGRVADAGADAVALINTLLGMVINTDTLRPALAGITGGLSGPAIRPVAVRAVYQVHAALPNLPILGMGGIRTGLDALEFFAAGASAVSVGTVIFNDPSAPARVHREIREELSRRGIRNLADIIGVAHRDVPTEAVVTASNNEESAVVVASESASLTPTAVAAGNTDDDDWSALIDHVRAQPEAALNDAERTAEVDL
ncbi:MAG: dihydroorotate dehydrogenase [Actinobacteria bacterium]|nr:dihydroorotate dehydrogenase [Actinomycetota bacterium]